MKILVTAGPTHEPIDAVRYLGNRSSGRMGVALAVAAADANHRVTLLLGPAMIDAPVHDRVTIRRFRSAADLEALLTEEWPRHDVLLMAAAVADYRPIRPLGAGEKLRREGVGLTLQLEPTQDLLAGLAERSRPDQTLIGFALEPAADLRARAIEKMRRKRIHAIVANPLETMDGDTIDGTLLLRDGHEMRPERTMTKREFAQWLVGQLVGIRRDSA